MTLKQPNPTLALYNKRLLLLQEIGLTFSQLEPVDLLHQAKDRVTWLFENATLHVLAPHDLSRPPNVQRGHDCLEDLGEVYVAYHKGPPEPLYLALEGVELGDANEYRFAALFTEQLLTALSNAGYRQLLEQQALTDWRTGLGNYRSFEQTLNREDAGSRVLALVVLDNLLSVNAEEGYAAGDLLLRRLGEALKTLLPERSSVFRIGGDTFALMVLPQRVEEVRKSLSILPFDLRVVWQQTEDPIGLELLRRLDQRLMEKRSFRPPLSQNEPCVVVHCGITHLRETLQEAARAWSIEETVHLINDTPIGFALEHYSKALQPALILTEAHSQGYLHDLMAANPAGLIVGKVQKEQLISGLERVLGGETFYLGPKLDDMGLLPRERQVWRLIAQGKSNEHIAERLGVKVKTITNYVTNLQDKLLIRGRAALALHYYGRLELPE